jgi:putative MATE family efflux protein
MQNNELSMFETESLGKLMLKFSVPAIISMVVNSIYNIVDQIFIGWGVNYIGNAATNVTYPLVTTMMAFSTMIADGCVAYFSLKMGEKRSDLAAKTMGNGIHLALLAGVIMLVVSEIFMEPVLLLCGGTEQVMPYAIEYGRITMIGVPFVCISMTISSIIRAEGNPRYAMLCMITGCITNVVLDALFVLGFKWGMAGAAWATIIGQALNMVLALLYLPKFKSVKLEKANMKFDGAILKGFVPLGISSFFTQAAATVVTICMNNLMVKYGSESIYGADIPLAAFGIVMKVNAIIVSVMVGLGIGSQPIVGYNYGAKKYDRVKTVYLRTITIGTIVAACGWLCFQFCPQAIVNIFGQASDLYNEFAVKCFREFLCVCFLLGFIIPTGIFFQSIGKPAKAIISNMTRQLLFFIPNMFILSNIFGLQGLLYAGPVSDSMAAVVVLILLITEMHRINGLIKEQKLQA